MISSFSHSFFPSSNRDHILTLSSFFISSSSPQETHLNFFFQAQDFKVNTSRLNLWWVNLLLISFISWWFIFHSLCVVQTVTILGGGIHFSSFWFLILAHLDVYLMLYGLKIPFLGLLDWIGNGSFLVHFSFLIVPFDDYGLLISLFHLWLEKFWENKLCWV